MECRELDPRLALNLLGSTPRARGRSDPGRPPAGTLGSVDGVGGIPPPYRDLLPGATPSQAILANGLRVGRRGRRGGNPSTPVEGAPRRSVRSSTERAFDLCHTPRWMGAALGTWGTDGARRRDATGEAA